MDAVSKISGFSRKNVEDYTSLQEILMEVDAISNENFLQAQASEVIERFLKKKSPHLLNIGTERPVDYMSGRASIMTGRSMSSSPSRESTYATSPGLTVTRTSTSSSPALTSRSVLRSSYATHRINITHRLEMVERELEDSKMTMDKLRKIFESARFMLQTEEENLKTEAETIQESETTLVNFISENTDKKTGRVLHDKFLRFLENELQSKDRDLRKMKLKVKSLQTEYSRMKSQQQQKLELRERLHPVDLDKLHIENQEHLALLEQKTKQLLDLKRAVGKKGQSLVSLKSKLNDTMISLKNIMQDAKQKEAKCAVTETKESQNLNDLVAAEVLNQSIKKLNSTFRSPDVHSYLKMEVNLSELKKEKEVWERRCRNQKQTIILLEHQLKQLAPSESRSRSTRSQRSIYSCRSAESMLKPIREKIPFPHCTPTTPL